MKRITQVMTIIIGMVLLSNFVMAQSQEATPFPKKSDVMISNSTDNMWDLLFSFTVTAGGEQGVGSDGTGIYTTMWSISPNYYRKYNLSGQKIDSFLITGATAIRDLAYDGQYFYGGANSAVLRKMDFTTHTLVSSYNSGVSAIRHAAYDPTANSGQGGFWLGGWADLALCSKTGALLSTVPGMSLAGMYGTAFDGVTPGGPYLWIFDQGLGAGSPQLLQQFSIPNLTLTGITHDVSDVPGFDPVNGIAGGLESDAGNLYPGKYVLLGNNQQSPNLLFIYEVTLMGVNENEHQTIVNVYPNPAKDYLKISSSIYPILDLQVINYLGQVVYQEQTGTVETRINTSNFETGIYFVRVQTKDGIKTIKVNVD